MNQSMEKEIDYYLKSVYKHFLLLHSKKQSDEMLQMLHQSIDEYINDHQDVTFNEIINHFGDLNDYSEMMIYESMPENITNKIDNHNTNRRFKKLLFTLLAIIIFLISFLYIKAYIDAHDAMIHHEVIEIY